MRRLPRFTLLSLGVGLALALTLPAAASANAYGDVLANWNQHPGHVDACVFSSATLQQALKQIPNDNNQYASDFGDAIRDALRQRAAGVCDRKTKEKRTGGGASAAGGGAAGGGGGGSSSSTPPPASGLGSGSSGLGSGAGGTPKTLAAPPAPPTAFTHDAPVPAKIRPVASSTTGVGAPAALIALGGVGAAVVLAGLLLVLFRFRGWEPRWVSTFRQLLGETAWRAGSAMGSVTDRLRPR